MKVKIKSKRTVLKGIKQGNYNCLLPEMLKMHCGKIAKVVDKHPYSYGVKFDDEELDVTWYWSNGVVK